MSCVMVVKGTASMCVLTSFEFWFYAIVNLVLHILVVEEVIEIPNNYKLPWAFVSLVISVQTAAMVFFIGQAYDRYLGLYDSCMKLDEAAKVLTQQLVISANDPEVRGLLTISVKYLVSSILIFYMALAGGGLSEHEWDFIKSKGLLDDEDVTFIRQFPGHRGMLLTSWCMRCVMEIIQSKTMKGLFSPPERAALTNRVSGWAYTSENAMRDVADILAMPIPFSYWHTLNVILVFNFNIVGYSIASEANSLLSTFPYAIYVFVFMGLRYLAASLTDPFIDSVEDPMGCSFPLVSFNNYAYDHCILLVASIDHFDPHKKLENALHGFRVQDVGLTATRDLMYGQSQEGDHATSNSLKNFKTSPNVVQKKSTLSIGDRFRGDQKNVAYKWDPSGAEVTADREDSFFMQWIKRHEDGLRPPPPKAAAPAPAAPAAPAATPAATPAASAGPPPPPPPVN